MAEFHEIGSSQFTEVTPTGNEQIQISATQKTTLRKIANLFKAMNAVLTGFTPLGKGAPTISQTSTILQAFQALYQLVGGARTKILGTNGTTVGFVSWTDNLAYGILFDVEQEKIYIRNGWTATNPSNNTDAQWITAIRAGKAIPMGGGESIMDILMTGWVALTNLPTMNDLPILATDTLYGAIQKLSAGILNNGLTKIVSDGYSRLGIIMYNGDIYDTGSFIYFDAEIQEFAWGFENIDNGAIEAKTDREILDLMSGWGNSNRFTWGISMQQLSMISSEGNINLEGSLCSWYTGSITTPTITVHGGTFSRDKPTASVIVPYHINPIWVAGTVTTLHKHQNYDDVAPTSGYKIYTVFCQKFVSQIHAFINVAPYN